MVERFYSIKHLTTRQLREIYSTYITQGWKDTEYHDLFFEGITPPELSDDEIVLNIEAGRDTNYCVYMTGVEEEKDGVMFGFGMNYHQQYDYSVYLHLPLSLLDELVEKYGLTESHEAKDYTVNEFLIEDHMKNPLN